MTNPVVLKSRQKVTPKVVHGLEQTGVQPPVVDIRTNHGRVYSPWIDQVSGSPQNPIDIVAKFRDCTSLSARPLPEWHVEKLIELIAGLERVNDIDEISRLLC